mgnify:FL=1
MKFIYRYVLFVTLLVSYEGRAQIGLKLGTAPSTLSPNAILDLSGTTNRGFLLPRLALTGTANSAPLSGTITSGMLVYNTATAGDVTPGVYYADGTRWVRVAANGTGGTIQAPSTSLVSATSPAGTTGQIVYNTNAASGLPVGLVVWNGSGWVASSSGTNIYTADGTLLGNRTITMGSNNLTLTGAGSFRINGNSASQSFSMGGSGIFGIDAPGVINGRFAVLENGNVGLGTNSPSQILHVVGGALISGLSGTGSRMVVADATGVLSTQAIPSGGGAISSVTTGNGLNLASGVLSFTPPASLTTNLYTGNGSLSGARVVTQGANTLNFSGTGKLLVGTTSAGTVAHAGRLAAVSPGNQVTAFTVMNDSTSRVGNIASIGFRTQGSVVSAGLTASISGLQTGTGFETALVFNTFSGGSNFSERMRITSNGSVGINNSNPLADLDIRAKDGTVNTELNISAGYEDKQAILNLTTPFWLTENVKKTAIIAQGISSHSRADLHFVLNSEVTNTTNYTIGTDTKMIIKNSGNVGIGTITPTQRLHVVGGALISGLSGTGSRMVVADATGVLSTQALPASSNIYTSDGTLTGTRTVSLGTNNLIFKPSASSGMTFSSGNTAANNRIFMPSDGLEIQSNDATGTKAILSVFNNNAERFRVNNNGFVGIGTTTPNLGLVVNGGALPAARFEMNGNTNFGQVLEIGTTLTTGTDDPKFVFNYRGGTKYWSLGGGVGGSSLGDFNIVEGANGSGINRFVVKAGGNIGIGTTSPGYTLHVNGSVAGTSAYFNLSDARLKTNIQPLANSLEKVKQLNGVTFDWNQTADVSKKLDDKSHIGFIAQEVEKILPQVVNTASDEQKTKSVAYSDIIPVLVEAIKELSSKNEALQKQVSELEQLKAEVASIKALLQGQTTNTVQKAEK